VGLHIRSGKLIAIDGIDQSGKRTQTRLLAEKIRAFGYELSIWNFPDYKTPLGRHLRRYLAGRERFDFHAIHLLYAANKWERASAIVRDIDRGCVVLINRYTPSNLAYGMAHGLSRDWLELLEKALPKPDLVFILDVTPKASFKRKRELRDLHEENLSYLRKVRSTYLRLAKKYRWKVVDGERDQRAVGLELWSYVLPTLGK
jgi:dTMP kinase